MQLRKVGYKFTQIGGAFLVHFPHYESKAREEWNYRPKVLINKKKSGKRLKRHADEIVWSQFKRARVDELFLAFKRWLNENVEDTSRTPMCEDVLNDDYTLWVHPSKKEGNNDYRDDWEEGDGENVDDSADDDLREPATDENVDDSADDDNIREPATDKAGNDPGRVDFEEGDT
jgi:hypothetical protein